MPKDYKISGAGVRRITDGASIPASMDNSDWQEYQAWLAAGNTPDPEFTAAEILDNAKAEKNAALEAKAREEHFKASTWQTKLNTAKSAVDSASSKTAVEAVTL